MDDTDPERDSVKHKYNTHGGDSVTKILGKNTYTSFPSYIERKITSCLENFCQDFATSVISQSSAECPLNFAWP